jgi:hypothetical protein
MCALIVAEVLFAQVHAMFINAQVCRVIETIDCVSRIATRPCGSFGLQAKNDNEIIKLGVVLNKGARNWLPAIYCRTHFIYYGMNSIA